jgi:uncharacterized protein YhbP (UPF0306 family)
MQGEDLFSDISCIVEKKKHFLYTAVYYMFDILQDVLIVLSGMLPIHIKVLSMQYSSDCLHRYNRLMSYSLKNK